MHIELLKTRCGKQPIEQIQSRIDGFVAPAAHFAYGTRFRFGRFDFFRLVGEQQIEFMKTDKLQDIRNFYRKEHGVYFIAVGTHTHEQRI